MVRRSGRSTSTREDVAESGLSDRQAGMLWLGGGAFVTFFTYAIAAPGGMYLVAWGAMLYGAVKILGSLAEPRDEDGEALPYRDRIALGQDMAVRAMFFIAKDAGGIAGVRAQVIDQVLWRITDTEFPADRRAALLADSEAEGAGFLETLRAARDRMAPSFPEIVLQAAAKVALADGPLEPNIEAKLRQIAEALLLGAASVAAALTQAQAG